MRTRKRRKTTAGQTHEEARDQVNTSHEKPLEHSNCQKHIGLGTTTSNKCILIDNINLTCATNFIDHKLLSKSFTLTRPKKLTTTSPAILITLLYLSTWLTIYLTSYRPIIQLVDGDRFYTLQQSPQHLFSSQQQQQQQQSRTNLPDIITQQGGLIKDKNITLTKQNNPILITNDIIIKKGAKLTIESGTELLFEKKKGITVYGTLEILGILNDRVKLSLLKSQQSATVNFRSQNNNPIGQQQIRLVDGDQPNEGRVQIKFNDRWHSLCTGSKNLTATDIKVLCQQVGYQEGHLYRWFPRRNETILQMMSKSFHCTGSESAITQCKRWNRVRTGGGVCDYYSDIGIRCSKTLSFGTNADYEYWRGIEFFNSEASHEYVLGQLKQKVSRSNLRHLIIDGAGINGVGNATAAIRVHGQPPKMSNVEIKNSIYGIMIEDVDDSFGLSDIKLINNMANPLSINSSWGKVSLNNMHVENNGGDGIRYTRHEKFLVGSHDFCTFANLGSTQSFPVVLSHEQTFFTSGRDCCQEFISEHQLTLHFPVLRSTHNNISPDGDSNKRISIPPGVNLGSDASLLIYDDYRDEYPFKLRIQNDTRAQSIVSKSNRLKICYEPAQYRTVLFTIVVVTDKDDDNWTGIARDIEISNSYITSNQGRGIWIENQRSGFMISNTTVINHNYLSGIHVENGTGEVIIQGSKISHNIGHGVLINLAGGYYHIDNSTISDNTLRGISIEYDKRLELVPFNRTVHIGYSLLARNGENAVFLGNVCRSDATWNISMNSFIKNGEDAILFQSCSPSPQAMIDFRNLSLRLNTSDTELIYHNNYQELFITHNVFLANLRRAISLTPVFFVKSFIRHNLFKEHQLAVLYISNRDAPDFEADNYTYAPANIRVASNRFYSNRGRYVANLGLQEDNPRHSLIFTKNTLEDNIVSEPYTDLRPRSRVSAVVVVSSSNTKVIRNRFDNPQSSYEMGCHLEMHHKIINATTNFWGPGLDATSIYRRIFDRKNRYNLAQIEFLQYLLSPEDLEYASDLSFDRERDKISPYKNGTRLGGEVKGYDELNSGTYIVENDIYVRKGAHLILKPGTTLKFYDGVGMMVQGRLDAVGQAASQIVFTTAVAADRRPQRIPMTTTTTPSPLANPWVSHQLDGSFSEDEDSQTQSQKRKSTMDRDMRRRNLKKRDVGSIGSQNVRLSHTTMGRLEVQIDGVWGPVCDYNFDISDAAVVCQQLGMILNRDDWLLEKFQYAVNDRQQVSMMSANALMTNLRCDPSLDTDITSCKAELTSRGDFDGMCNSEIGVRCFPPSWSGVRLGMGADTSTLEHVTIQKAGMFDYAAYSLKPALQVDLNRHVLSSLNIKFNSDSGIGIMWNDVIGRHFSELTLSDSKFHNNERHGIELRSKGLSLKNISLSNNRQNGLDYNPTYSQKELTDLLSWLYTAKNPDHMITLSFPLPSKQLIIPSSEDSYKFIVFQNHPQPDLRETFTIATEPGHMLSIHQLIPIHPDSSETLNMSLGNSAESPIWDLRSNTTSFPMVSPSYKFHFNYSTGKKPRGNIVLYIRSRFNNRDLKTLSKYVPQNLIAHRFEQTAININTRLINLLVITNSTIVKNRVGLNFKHSNYPYDRQQDTYSFRYANETTNITDCIFDGNHYSTIFVNSGDLESSLIHSSTTVKTEVPASEIYYNLVGNKIRRNKDGIRQFSRDIRSSNNVFHWSINDTMFDYNKGGGINIILPYFWRYDANLSHTIDFHNNTFLKNSNLELILDGHFAAIDLTKNIFRENKCKGGMITFGGMEKKMLIRYNIIEHNTCTHIIDSNIQSHADKLGSIVAQVEYNSIKYNRKQTHLNASHLVPATTSKDPRMIAKLNPRGVDYAICIRGVQSMNITRNLLVNPELRFELVVGIIMDPNERTVMAHENYWGSVIQSDIEDRIFDFDDWNNYAVAEISPYLTQDSFYAANVIASAKSMYQMVNVYKPLGGRLTKSITLASRREPYLIESDFTVMPNVRLTIEKGVTLEFMPNVGILVLGELIVSGTREKPIRMRPYLSAQDVLPLHQYLHPAKTKPTSLHNYMNDPLSFEYNYPFRHDHFAYSHDLGSIRLCKNEICNDGTHIYENNVEDQTLRQEVLRTSTDTWKMDGFLEIFNMTTLQWVPVCDPLFSEHSAKVICRQLGYTHLSLMKRGRRHTLEYEQVASIRHWPESVQCEGDESNLASCLLAAGFINHTTSCSRDSNQFVYIYCQDFPETTSVVARHHGLTDDLANHWGGLRFSCPSVSLQGNINLDGGGSDSRNMISKAGHRDNVYRSRLSHIIVERAGMLHGRRSPAIQVLQCPVQIEHVTVENSAHHGVEIITSHGNQNFHQLRLRNCLGTGFNYVSLTGSSSASRSVQYLPLKHLDISSDIFGLVDICGANKEIQIDERLLIFYKYSSKAVDCAKIISSKLDIKHIGVRLLQFDLFNSTSYTTRPDFLRVYDGNIFDRDSRLLVELGVTERHRLEKPELKFYQTTDNTATLRLHASGASALYGFIAEVVTTPVSYNIQRDTYNNLTSSEFTGNKLGAVSIYSAGESSPNLIIKNNRIESNCMHLFGNFTSCVNPVYMELQNCQILKVMNNLIKSNQGGIMIKSYSHSAVSALEALIEFNVFESNQNTNVLSLLGPKTDPYQTVKVMQNFFTRNVAQHLSNIVLSRIVANFSYNIMSGNIGKHQIEVVGFDKLPISYQTFVGNWIYNNTATFERDRSTVFGNSAGQQYLMNYLVNPDNHFEISTMNWSRYDVKNYHVPKDDEIIHLLAGDGSTRDVIRKIADAMPVNIIDTKKNELYHATINAKNNWWGFSSGSAIQGRIRDRIQHEELIKVEFMPFLETNKTVLSGICSGGWRKVGEACLVYITTRMTYQEARDFCDREQATLPLLRGNHYEFSDFAKLHEPEFDAKVDRIWVRSFDFSREACPALNDYRTKNYDCRDKYSFICEKDPQIVVSLLHWHRETGGLVALILALITVILTLCCTLCWGYKSRQRHKEKIERKNTIYASMRSNRGPYSSNNSLSELFLHRQIYNPEKSSITDLSLSTQMTQPSELNNLPRAPPPTAPTVSTPVSNIMRPNGISMEPAPVYANSRPKPYLFNREPLNEPTYIQPPPSQPYPLPPMIQQRQQEHQPRLKKPPPVPAPTYRESQISFSNGSSRTPSYASSQSDQVSTNPMPYVATTYSQIRHAPDGLNNINNNNNNNNNNDQYFKWSSQIDPTDGHSQTEKSRIASSATNGSTANNNNNNNRPIYYNSQQQQVRDIDESESSVPTNYSNNYEESTQSYIETQNDVYSKTIQSINNDQSSYTLTERSSTTDFIMSSQLSQLTQASTIDSRANLMSNKRVPLPGSSDGFLNVQERNMGANEMFGTNHYSNTALSEAASSSHYHHQPPPPPPPQHNRYFVETSFDFDDTPRKVPPSPASMFGSSQRLSPVSSSYAPPDSKHGSRVYLETDLQ